MVVLFLVVSFIIFWTYLGYYIFLKIVQRGFLREHEIDENYLPRVSVVIPTYNEEKSIVNKINNTLSLKYPSELLEIIIIDDSSTDNTVQIIKKYFGGIVKIYQKKQRAGKADSINISLKIITSDLIFFTDADVNIEENSLKSMVRHFGDMSIGAVSGITHTITDKSTNITIGENYFWNYENNLVEYESRIDSRIYITGSLFIIRNSILKKIKLPTNSLAEDFELCIKIKSLGYRILNEPQAIGLNRVPLNLHNELMQRKRTAIGTIQVLLRSWKYLFNNRLGYFGLLFLFSHKLLPMISPFVLITLLILNVILFLQNSFFIPLVTFVLLIFIVVVILIAELLKILNVIKKNILLVLVNYFFTLQLAVFVAWFDLLTKNYSVQWKTIR